MEKKLADKDMKDKPRYDLIPVYPLEVVARILTKALKEEGGKYDPHNWRKGRQWSTTIAAMKRHIAAFEALEDIDEETQEHHLGSVLCNAMFLLEHTITCPELDDRPEKVVGRNGKIQTKTR